MSFNSLKYWSLVVATAAWTLWGCSEGTDDGDDGTGGTAAGGTSSEGGSGSGDAGASSAGAPGQIDCQDAEVQGSPLHAFETNLDGFNFERYAGDEPYKNLAYSADNPYPGTRALIDWVEATGPDGDSGVVELNVPYGGYDELVDIQYALSDDEEPLDWSGKILRAYVKVLDGFVPTEDAPGGSYIFVKTVPNPNGFIYGRGSWTNLDPRCYGHWVELEFLLDVPDDYNEGYDPTQVVALGIQVATGQGPLNAEEMAPTPARVQIDHITIDDR